MSLSKRTPFIALLSILSLLLATLPGVATAGVISPGEVLEHQQRHAAVSRIEALLSKRAVAAQLEGMGVDQRMLSARVAQMSTAELLKLDGKLAQQTAGGDVVGIVGAVFVVLIVLELVGVVDIFKAI